MGGWVGGWTKVSCFTGLLLEKAFSAHLSSRGPGFGWKSPGVLPSAHSRLDSAELGCLSQEPRAAPSGSEGWPL